MSTVLLFAACQMRSCENVAIVDDEVVENEESFFVTLEDTPDLNSRIHLTPTSGEIEITDGDSMPFTM